MYSAKILLEHNITYESSLQLLNETKVETTQGNAVDP